MFAWCKLLLLLDSSWCLVDKSFHSKGAHRFLFSVLNHRTSTYKKLIRDPLTRVCVCLIEKSNHECFGSADQTNVKVRRFGTLVDFFAFRSDGN